MKTVFFGGGSHRLISILRGALARRGVFDHGHIHLYDLNVTRAEAVAKIVMQSPEFGEADCQMTWGNDLDSCLEGADAVAVILMAGSPLSFAMGQVASDKWGFMCSDNVSPNGALLGVKGAPILLDLARRMEKKCPNAWLLDFANPVAVLSAMVNRHTTIKTLGLCQGFTNHFWDISRIFGKDEYGSGIDVEAAGINHLSFIVKGTMGGKELFSQLDKHLKKPWQAPRLQNHWSQDAQKNIIHSVSKLVQLYRELGVLVFSSESDGMIHLEYEEALQHDAQQRNGAHETPAQAEEKVSQGRCSRQAANEHVASLASSVLDKTFWDMQGPESLCGCLGDDIFLRALTGIAGVEEVKIVSSRLNQGAIDNLPEEVVCEYSQTLFRETIKPFGRYHIPNIVQGLTSALAVHQTMLADACATGDPKLLAQALIAYPMRPYSKAARGLYKDLIEINRDDIPASLRNTGDFL